MDATSSIDVKTARKPISAFKVDIIGRSPFRPTKKHEHAVQLELAQRTYMSERAPYDYIPRLAGDVRPVLERFVRAMLDWIEVRLTRTAAPP